MRVVFMGTSPFAVPSLDALVKAGHEVVIVVTQPDRPKGRGLEMQLSPVKQRAVELNLPVFQPEKIRQEPSVERIRELTPIDAIVVAAFGQIIPKSILDIPRLGSINVHASLLPKYRGAAPIHYAIAAGETVTGVTTMLMDPGLDTGDMLLKAETPIGPEETTGELEVRLAEIGAELLIQTLAGLDRGEITPVLQDNSQATLAPSIKREAGEIDWTQPAKVISDKIRAYTPRPGAYTIFEGRTLKLWRARPGSSETQSAPGQVIAVTSEGVEVAAGEGTLVLLEVQPEGKKRMSATDFARGARIQPDSSNFSTNH